MTWSNTIQRGIMTKNYILLIFKDLTMIQRRDSFTFALYVQQEGLNNISQI
jgi:hypothetical protein